MNSRKLLAFILATGCALQVWTVSADAASRKLTPGQNSKSASSQQEKASSSPVSSEPNVGQIPDKIEVKTSEEPLPDYYRPSEEGETKFGIGLQIQRTGDLIPDSRVYRSTVTLNLTVDNASDGVLIKDHNLWMSLSPIRPKEYQVQFRESQDYQLEFCTVSSSGSRGPIVKESFTIDAALDEVVTACKALPDLQTATDATVQSARDQILSVQRQYNNLNSRRRGAFPEAEFDRMTKLLRWIHNIQPTLDIYAPESPNVTALNPSAAGAQVYDSGVQFQVQPTADTVRTYFRSGEEWTEITPVNGSYLTPPGSFNEPGDYVVDFCGQDTAGNKSPTKTMEFTVSPKLYAFLNEAGATTGPSAEKALMDYYALELDLRSKVDPVSVERLIKLVEETSDAASLSYKSDTDGKTATAIGMLGAFPAGNVSFSMTGKTPSLSSLPGVSKAITREYAVDFWNVVTGAYAAQGGPILIRMEVPSVLKGQKGVKVYDDGGLVQVSRIRNMDEGLILEFQIEKPGRYYIASDRK